jgi:hypothetical protein
LDEIYAWVEVGGKIMLPEPEAKRLNERLGARRANLTKRNLHLSSIRCGDLSAGLALADRLLMAVPVYAVANPISAIVLTYQAMILHGRQHAGASIALSAVVAESAVAELISGFGLVTGVARRLPLPAKAKHPLISPMSRTRFDRLRFGDMVKTLRDQGLLNIYLAERIEELRRTRNNLMHESKEPDSRRSGQALTAVRDLLWLCTDETGFELNTSWTYRC